MSLDIQFIGEGGRVAVRGARAQEVDAVRGALAVLAADGAPDPPVAEGGQVGTGLVSVCACQSGLFTL